MMIVFKVIMMKSVIVIGDSESGMGSIAGESDVKSGDW